MKPKLNENIKSFLGKKTTRTICAVMIVLIIAGSIIIPRVRKSSAAFKNGANAQRTETVKKGEISTTVSGSGPIESENRVEIIARGDTTVDKVHFKEGDSVKEGDLLMELDSTDAQLEVEKSRSNLTQTQMSQENNIEDLNGLMVKAPFDGQVKNIAVKEGNVISKNSSVLTIVDTSKLKVLLQFSGLGINEVSVGKKATVYIQDFMEAIDGVVTYISNASYPTSSGGEIYNIEIEINNLGAISEGAKVSAEIDTSLGTLSSVNSGNLEYVNSEELKCAGGGTVKNINVKENQFVRAGELLVEVENKELEVTKGTTDVKLKEYEEQLNTSIKQLGYYTIYAPIDGIIVKQEYTEGDTVEKGETLCIVADDKNMQFSVNIDELDIEKLEIGQKVDITVDAIEETSTKPITGTVSKIAIEGTSENGVTTYPVTIKADNSDKLKIGMNADAEIYISRKSDVLYVPLEATHRVGGKTYVMVKGDEAKVEEMKKNGTYTDIFTGGGRTKSNGTGNNGQASSSQNSSSKNSALKQNEEYYKDAIPTLVEVGLSDETNIEIVSGLNEGDVVILPAVQTGNTQTNTSQQRQQGGGMPGGMPIGGMQRAR